MPSPAERASAYCSRNEDRFLERAQRLEAKDQSSRADQARSRLSKGYTDTKRAASEHFRANPSANSRGIEAYAPARGSKGESKSSIELQVERELGISGGKPSRGEPYPRRDRGADRPSKSRSPSYGRQSGDKPKSPIELQVERELGMFSKYDPKSKSPSPSYSRQDAYARPTRGASGSPASNASRSVEPRLSSSSPKPASPKPGSPKPGSPKPNPLAEAMEREARSRGSESPSRGSPRSTAAMADPAHYRPYPEDEYMEISPSSGGLVMNEWDRIHNTPPDEIIPGFMWLGAERGAICPNCPPFSHVLFATNKPTSPYPARHYLCIELADDPDTDLAARFAESNEFIAKAHKQKGSKLLIHCRMGQSRSSTLVAAYLMWHYRCSLRDALVWTKERRRIIAPNTGFFIQMQQYEKELFGVSRSSISRDQARKLGVCSVGKGPDGM